MKPRQRLSPVKRLVAVRMVPAFVILASTFFLVVGVQNTRLARESASWPAVEGEIVRSGVEEEVSRPGSGRPGQGSTSYRATVHYRYRVAGVDYSGERVALGEHASEDRADAEAVVRKYPAGRRVPVHYRPVAPDTAVLEIGSHGVPWLYAALGGVFLLAGLVLAWIAPKLIASAGRPS